MLSSLLYQLWGLILPETEKKKLFVVNVVVFIFVTKLHECPGRVHVIAIVEVLFEDKIYLAVDCLNRKEVVIFLVLCYQKRHKLKVKSFRGITF